MFRVEYGKIYEKEYESKNFNSYNQAEKFYNKVKKQYEDAFGDSAWINMLSNDPEEADEYNCVYVDHFEDEIDDSEFKYSNSKSLNFMKTLLHGKRQVQTQRKPIEDASEIKEQYKNNIINSEEACEKLLKNNYAISKVDAQCIVNSWNSKQKEKILNDVRKLLEDKGFDIEIKDRALSVETKFTCYIIAEKSPGLFNVIDLSGGSEDLTYNEIDNKFNNYKDDDTLEDENTVRSNYLRGDISENSAIEKLMAIGFTKNQAHDFIGTPSPEEQVKLSEILDWLSEHEEAWKDFCHAFGYEEGEEIEEIIKTTPVDEFEDWLSEHDELREDYDRRFYGAQIIEE